MVYFGYPVVFVCISNAVSVSVISSDNSFSEWLILFICEVWMLFTYCSCKFSVSSKFIVTSAFSSLFTSYLKSKSGSRNEEGCDFLFFMAIFCN